MKKNNLNSSIRLFELLSAIAPSKVFLSITLGCVGGLAYAIFVPLILLSLEPSLSRIMQPDFDSSYWLFGVFEISSPKQASFFIFVCLVILFCRGTSGTLMAQVAVDATVGLRKNFYRRISQLPIQKLDQIGPSRLLTALNNDIKEITEGASAIPAILIAFSTFFGLVGFLIYLKLEVFLFVMGVIFFGVIFYQIPIKLGRRYLGKARDSFDGIQEGMRGLIFGAKELKLNQQKRHDFLTESLHTSEDEFSTTYKRGRMFLIFAMTYSNMISFFAIGAVTYIMSNYYALSLEDTVAVVMVLLYITGPITAMTNAIPPIMIAKVAARKLDALLNEMSIEPQGEVTDVIDGRSLQVKGVEYVYPTLKNEAAGFQLGPIDLTIHRGEVTFLVGGNGSGKTTLAKLLSLHYIPEKGHIYFDDQIVTDNNRNACRQSISAIYSDFYLFTKLFGLSSSELDRRAAQSLKQLGLEGKVTIKKGEFSSTDLSDGQKKRLALLVANLEDRSIYVFDEWAADQDPSFKEIFYHSILAELKKLNKMVIVITHDDRYFHLADKLVRMESGKILDEDTYRKMEEIETTKHAEETEIAS
jgi:putative pyoverdin transport system ATP-binding/permease protein